MSHPVLRRVTRALTFSEEYPLAQASRLSSRFRLAHPVEVHDFPDKGNINQHTYLVFAGTPYDFPLRLAMVERHPLGSQGFVPLHDRPFLVVVAPAGAEPGPEAVRAFLTDGRQGVSYYRGTWHHYQLTLDQPGDYLVIDRAGPGLNLDEHRLAQPLVIERVE